MENKNKRITYEEYNRVFECIYTYLKSLDISQITGNMWKLEYFTTSKKNQIMVQRVSNRAEKQNENILGGYTAVLPFYINYQSTANTESALLKITDPLDNIANIFENETNNGFVNIEFPDDIIPQRLEMITNPGGTTLENNITVFTAMYQFTYYKKGVFE